VVLDWYQVLSD